MGSLRIQPNHATNAQSQSIHLIVHRLVIRHVVSFSLSCLTFLAMSSYPFCHTGVFVYHVDVHDSLYCCTRLQYYCTRFPRCYSRLPNCCTRMLCRCTHFAIMLSLAAMSLGLFAMLLYPFAMLPICHVVVPVYHVVHSPCCCIPFAMLYPFYRVVRPLCYVVVPACHVVVPACHAVVSIEVQSCRYPVPEGYRTSFAPNHLLLVTQVGLETALCG